MTPAGVGEITRICFNSYVTRLYRKSVADQGHTHDRRAEAAVEGAEALLARDDRNSLEHVPVLAAAGQASADNLQREARDR